jgi:hypothetical protein
MAYRNWASVYLDLVEALFDACALEESDIDRCPVDPNAMLTPMDAEGQLSTAEWTT